MTTFSAAWFDTESESIDIRTLDLGIKTPMNILCKLLTNSFIDNPIIAEKLKTSIVILVERPLSAGRFQHLVTTKLWVLFTTLESHPTTRAKFMGVDPKSYVPMSFGLVHLTRAEKKRRTVEMAIGICEKAKDADCPKTLLQVMKKPDDIADAILIGVAWAVHNKYVTDEWITAGKNKIKIPTYTDAQMKEIQRKFRV